MGSIAASVVAPLFSLIVIEVGSSSAFIPSLIRSLVKVHFGRGVRYCLN
jgi:hypothetical protein